MTHVPSEGSFNHHYPIPRMSFEFDPNGIGNNSEFNITVIKKDLDTCVPLQPALLAYPETGLTPRETILSAEQQNIGGSLKVAEDDKTYEITYGYTPLPPKAKAKKGQEFYGFMARMHFELEPQREHHIGRSEILSSVVDIAGLQYQYAVPPQEYDPNYGIPLVRVAFVGSMQFLEPAVVITHEFDKALPRVPKLAQLEVTDGLVEYFDYLDPHKDRSEQFRHGMTVEVPGGFKTLFTSDSGSSSFGRRSDYVTEEEIELAMKAPDKFDRVRLQPGDAYLASGHNLDLISWPMMTTLYSIGSLCRVIRELKQRTN